MTKKRAQVQPKKLKDLVTKFSAFLQDVSLLYEGHEARQREPDGLFQFVLKFDQDGAWLEEPNLYGPLPYKDSQFFYLQWGDEPLAEAVSATSKLCPDISKKRIEEALIGLMVALFTDQASEREIAPELESLLSALDTSSVEQDLETVVQELRKVKVPHIVYVPIEGLELRMPELVIGQVKLRSRSRGSEFDQIIEAVELELKPSISSAMGPVRCYATVEIEGDSAFVKDEAVRQVTEVIHILNLCLSSSMYQPSWARIRISPVIISRASPSQNLDNDFLTRHTAPMARRRLELTRDRLLEVLGPAYDPGFAPKPKWQRDMVVEKVITQGLQDLSACFQAKSQIARRIRRAVTWYSQAVDASTPEEQFVNLAIALESLLIGDEGKGLYATTGSISQRLGERVAFLLEDDFESRFERDRQTGKLYGIRSKIIHHGEKVSQANLIAMDALVKQVTLAFLQHQFKNWNAFLEWIAQQKYEKKAEEPTGEDESVESSNG
jgi:hypothetical protein